MNSRVMRALRSRRLAVSLLAVIVAYMIIATLIPAGGGSDAAVGSWAVRHPLAEAVAGPLGMHHPYSSPLFVALAVLLALATSACALERSRRAWRLLASARRLPEATLERLRSRPQLDVPLPRGRDGVDALDGAGEELRGLGLRVHTREGAVDGSSGVFGLLGSPLFHWSLVALMVVAALGQLTRAEGSMGLPVGERVADRHENYLAIAEAPLFRERHTGIELVATRLDRDFVAGGVDYGASPYISAYGDDGVIASRQVHPNSPLRAGALMVHMAGFGPAAVLSIESSTGAEVARQSFLFDRSAVTSSGTEPQVFRLAAAGGAAGAEMRISVMVHRQAPGKPTPRQPSRVVIESASGGTTFGRPVVLAVGQAMPLAEGQRLRLARVGDWVRVNVANDWSVPYIYALLVIAVLGLAVALLVPYRRVIVAHVPQDGEASLHAVVYHTRGDAAYRDRVGERLRARARGQEES